MTQVALRQAILMKLPMLFVLFTVPLRYLFVVNVLYFLVLKFKRAGQLLNV